MNRRDPLAGALAQSLRALAFRVADLEARVGELAGAISKAWERIERGRIAAPVATLAPAPLPARVSAGQAAELLGCSTPTVRRHLREGRLKGAAVAIPGSSRKRWTVEVAALASLVIAPDRSHSDIPSASSTSEKG